MVRLGAPNSVRLGGSSRKLSALRLCYKPNRVRRSESFHRFPLKIFSYKNQNSTNHRLTIRMIVNNFYPTKKDSKSGWYSRGFLPHYDDGTSYQFITFRLADSIPEHVLRDAQLQNKKTFFNLTEKYLDNLHGELILRIEDVAKIVQESLFFGHGTRYEIVRWVIMPNHIHLLIKAVTNFPVWKAIKLLKSFTANQVNILLNREGAVWARDYFDRYIRDEEHFNNCVQYIDFNPVKAKLVSDPILWKWGSLGFNSEIFRKTVE